MIVFVNTITRRVKYIFDFIGKEIADEPFLLTEDAGEFRQYHGPKINYSGGKISDSEIHIKNVTLLFETGIHEQQIECFETSNTKAIFKTDGGDFPFDVFAASFYLLSRYEEYLPHKKDRYGRYAHENSIAFKKNFLHLPLINIWLQYLINSLKAKFPDYVNATSNDRHLFQFIPTYDIDEAYAFKHKQSWRTFGGLARSVLMGDWPMINERLRVLIGKREDPYDSFKWINDVNKRFDLRPIYFFLMAPKTARYDKNILPSTQVMQDLIKNHSKTYPIGIHPSWQSNGEEEQLQLEKKLLEQISGLTIKSSRQHYIRLSLPHTYRTLISSGIEKDFSMGYGGINGFRASVCSPFYWYDLEREQSTGLELYPFCFMDANSFYEENLPAERAFDELKHYHNAVKSVRGTLVTIWHNNFLGTGKTFAGWREMYERFISDVNT